VGDAADATFLADAFRDADAVYAMLPPAANVPDYRAHQDRLGEAMVAALRDAGTRYVVFLSSVGADQPAGTGFVERLHAQEQRLRTLPETNLLLLRPGSFFENFFAYTDLIRQEGIIADAVAADVPMPMIATRDIAAAAAQALQRRDWQGVVVRELLGPRDLSYAEATRLLGERFGRPDLPYVTVSYAAMAETLQQVGYSADTARLHVELARALNDGTVRSLEGRTPANTTPTCFGEFAIDFAAAYYARLEESR